MTDEEKKLVCEWCGLKLTYSNWVMPDGKEYPSLDEVILDLNFYFKYAVPTIRVKAIEEYGIDEGIKATYTFLDVWIAKIAGGAYDPAEAFGQALLKLIRR